MADANDDRLRTLRDLVALTFCKHQHWIARSVQAGIDGDSDTLRACDVCLALATEALASERTPSAPQDSRDCANWDGDGCPCRVLDVEPIDVRIGSDDGLTPEERLLRAIFGTTDEEEDDA